MVCEASRLQLVEFVANFRWLLQLLSKHLPHFKEHRYDSLFDASAKLESSLCSAMSEMTSIASESVLSSTSTEALFRVPFKDQRNNEIQLKSHLDDDSQRIAALIYLSCSGYVYLLAAEVLLSTSPQTLHPFLHRAVNESLWTQSNYTSAVEGNCQSFVLLIRWLIHEQILTEIDVLQMLIMREDTLEYHYRVGCKLGPAEYKVAAEHLAATGAHAPFHLVGHLFLTQQLLLQEFCNLTTTSQINSHIFLLQHSLRDNTAFGSQHDQNAISMVCDKRECGETVEKLLLMWIRLVVRIEFQFQLTRHSDSHKGPVNSGMAFRSPYMRLLSICLDELENGSDLYEVIRSGLAIAILLHFYLPDNVPDPYKCSSCFSGMWQCAIHFAKEYLNIDVPFCASQALEYADSALSVHVFGFLQYIFLSVSARAEQELRELRRVGAGSSTPSTFLTRFSTIGVGNVPPEKEKQIRFKFFSSSDDRYFKHESFASCRTEVTSSQNKVLDAIAERLLSRNNEIEEPNNNNKDQVEHEPIELSIPPSPSALLLPQTEANMIGSSLQNATPLKPMSGRRRTKRSSVLLQNTNDMTFDYSAASNNWTNLSGTASVTPSASGRSHKKRIVPSKREGRVDHTKVPPFGTFFLRSPQSSPSGSARVVRSPFSGVHVEPNHADPRSSIFSNTQAAPEHSVLSDFAKPDVLRSNMAEDLSQEMHRCLTPSAYLPIKHPVSGRMPVGVLLAEHPVPPKCDDTEKSSRSPSGSLIFPSSGHNSSESAEDELTSSHIYPKQENVLPLGYLGVLPQGYYPLPVTEASYSNEPTIEDIGESDLVLPRGTQQVEQLLSYHSSPCSTSSEEECVPFIDLGNHAASIFSGPSASTCTTTRWDHTLDTNARKNMRFHDRQDREMTTSSIAQETSGIYEIVNLRNVGDEMHDRNEHNRNKNVEQKSSGQIINDETIGNTPSGTMSCVITARLKQHRNWKEDAKRKYTGSAIDRMCSQIPRSLENPDPKRGFNSLNAPSGANSHVSPNFPFNKKQDVRKCKHRRPGRASLVEELVASTFNGTIVCVSQDAEDKVRSSESTLLQTNPECQFVTRSDVTLSYPHFNRRISESEEGNDELAASDISSSRSFSSNDD